MVRSIQKNSYGVLYFILFCVFIMTAAGQVSAAEQNPAEPEESDDTGIPIQEYAFMAESREDAERIAQEYGAILLSYQYGIGELQMPGKAAMASAEYESEAETSGLADDVDHPPTRMFPCIKTMSIV